MGEAAAANRLPPEMILPPMLPNPLLRKLPSLPRSPGSEGAWVGAGAGAGVYTTGGAGLRVVTTTVLVVTGAARKVTPRGATVGVASVETDTFTAGTSTSFSSSTSGFISSFIISPSSISLVFILTSTSVSYSTISTSLTNSGFSTSLLTISSALSVIELI